MVLSSGRFVSNCCDAPLIAIEIDVCSKCMEHCEAIEELEYED